MMNPNRNNEPIFIVGIPRSGTTLLAAMLGTHSRLSCGPETRFFHFLADVDRDLLFKSWPESGATFLFSIKLIDSVPKHYGFNREQIINYLQDRPQSVPVILSALTEQFMEKEKKKRWVEKSPEHLMYVRDIRRFFPHSPIIRIIRDPRDVALSLVKTPWGPQDFLEGLMYWRRYDDQSAPFFEKDKNCHTLYYENLIQSPGTELKQLCLFLDEEYEDQMLDTSHSARSVVTENETWKQLVHKPVDLTRIRVWKKEITNQQNRIAEAVVGDRLTSYGYPLSESFEKTAKVIPAVEYLLEYKGALESFVNAGIRFWFNGFEDKEQVLIYVGEPDRDNWLRQERPERWWDTMQVISRILVRRISQKPVYWVRRHDKGMNLGYCGRILALVFQLTGKYSLA